MAGGHRWCRTTHRLLSVRVRVGELSRRLWSRADTEFLIDAGQRGLDGTDGDEESCRDLFVCQAVRGELREFLFGGSGRRYVADRPACRVQAGLLGPQWSTQVLRTVVAQFELQPRIVSPIHTPEDPPVRQSGPMRC